MRPLDLALLRVPAGPTLRDGLLLVSVSGPDPEDNRYPSALTRVPLDGGEPTPWTWGDRDSEPVLSPDGRRLAFLRGVGEKHLPQLHVMPVDGGEARVLTDLPLGVSAPVWSPDSTRLAFTARVPEPGRYGTPTEPGGTAPEPDEEAPRRITVLDYRLDEVGYVGDRHSRLFVVDATAPTPAPVELTDGRSDVDDPAWTPDGGHVIVVAPRGFAAEALCSDLYAVPSGGGEPALVASIDGWAYLPTVTDDGLVVFLGSVYHNTLQCDEANNHGLWAVLFRPDEPGTPHRLTDVETVDVEPGAGRPVPVGGDVLVCVRNRGAIELRRVPLDAAGATLAELPVVLGRRGAVTAFAADGDRIVAVLAGPESPGEVVLVSGDEVRTLTDIGAPLRAAGLRPLAELTGTAPDGYPVHGFLMLPEGPGPHPVLLHVHGGPFMYHGWGFFDEAQAYAAAGYAVVLANPRGSAGYGQAHGRAIVRALATVDVADLLAILDAALARPDLDADRVGVMGGSYGGFMTSWLAAHHGERFRAAWSERALNSWESFTGSSDIGWFFTDGYVGPDPEQQRAKSPLTYADKVTIPFAVVHAEDDLRCPFEQAQRQFVALRRNGVDAELLVFPGEGHELTRSGLPRHRVQRLDAVLDWWARHLPAAGR